MNNVRSKSMFGANLGGEFGFQEHYLFFRQVCYSKNIHSFAYVNNLLKILILVVLVNLRLYPRASISFSSLKFYFTL